MDAEGSFRVIHSSISSYSTHKVFLFDEPLTTRALITASIETLCKKHFYKHAQIPAAMLSQQTMTTNRSVMLSSTDLKDAIIISNGAVVVDFIIIVINVSAIHQCINVIGPQFNRFI